MTFSHAALDQYETVQTEVRDTARSLGQAIPAQRRVSRSSHAGSKRGSISPDAACRRIGNRLRAAVSHN